MKKHVVIVGAGACGFFTAANLDPEKCHVTLLEQNADVLQKVKISGGGRCNVTHAEFDPRILCEYYPRGNKELRSVFSKFQPADTIEWFEQRGVHLKTEQDGRMFPESNSSSTIIECFKKEVLQKGFEIRTKTKVTEILYQNPGFIVKVGPESIYADYLVYATGSTPKSLNILHSFGHTIIPQVPSLFTFNIEDPLLEGLAGTSFTLAQVEIPSLNSFEQGPLLITHWGLSGPAILKSSAWKARELGELDYQFNLKINFVGLSFSDAMELLLKNKAQQPSKKLIQSKPFEITQRFWAKIVDLSVEDPNKPIGHLTKKEAQQIVENLTQKTFSVKGKSTFKEEFVSAGGVDLKEIDFKTMQSRKIQGLYLGGEVLNIDAVTGGFNFQACWSEGFLISQHLNSH